MHDQFPTPRSRNPAARAPVASMRIATEAMQSGRCVELGYDGHRRVVEVHAVGYTRLAEPMMLVWQVRSTQPGSKAPGWRWLKLADIKGAVLSEQRSKAPREGYLRNDKTLTRIVDQV
jgi:hypothetical protein